MGKSQLDQILRQIGATHASQATVTGKVGQIGPDSDMAAHRIGAFLVAAEDKARGICVDGGICLSTESHTTRDLLARLAPEDEACLGMARDVARWTSNHYAVSPDTLAGTLLLAACLVFAASTESAPEVACASGDVV